jgi:hypothetical protein
MIQFDLEQVRRFGQVGLTDWEMATAFGCSARTIERARKQEASGFEAAYRQGLAETNIVGSYFIVAFLAGFSERYLLRVLDIKAEKENETVPEQIETNATAKANNLQVARGNESDGKDAKGTDNVGSATFSEPSK